MYFAVMRPPEVILDLTILPEVLSKNISPAQPVTGCTSSHCRIHKSVQRRGSKQCQLQHLMTWIQTRAQTRNDWLFILGFIQLHLIWFSVKIKENSFLITILNTFGNHWVAHRKENPSREAICIGGNSPGTREHCEINCLWQPPCQL